MIGRIALAALDASKVIVLVVGAVLLQVTIATDVTVLGGYPDFVVLVVVALALLRGPVVGAVTGFVGGFLLDCLGLGVVGTTSLTLVVVGYLVGSRGERLADSATVRPLIAIAVGSAAAALGELVVAIGVGSGPSISAGLVAATIPRAALNVLLGIAGYPLVRRILRRARTSGGFVATEAPG